MHEQGIGTEADPAEAARWLCPRGRAEGNPLALFKTARAWQTGLLGRVDLAKAADLYRAAAQAGVGAASFNLAVMAENGQGNSARTGRAPHTLYAQGLAPGRRQGRPLPGPAAPDRTRQRTPWPPTPG